LGDFSLQTALLEDRAAKALEDGFDRDMKESANGRNKEGATNLTSSRASLY
jgi:hypothetical protein